MTKIKISATIAAMLIAVTSWAVPARRTPFTITLSNGEKVTVVKRGDEHKHWIETTSDRQIILQNSNGTYRRATQQEQDSIIRMPEHNVMRKTPRNAAGQFEPTFPTTGEMRSLVILVNFADVKMSSETPQQDFQRMMTEEGYADLGGTGSARDYYIENSMGQFIPQFDVVGPVELPNGYAYYGANKAGGDDIHATDMIIEACRMLDDDVDFSLYDYNNDGYIDNVFVFYAGYGEATTNDANTIWPHSYDITSYQSVPVMLDGKRLDHYACTNELDASGRMDGIGTFVHEFGHVLGLPDLYSTQYTNAFTPGTWSVMDEGEYNNNSRTPPYFTVYERYALGWLTPVELGDAASVAMQSIDTNEAYIITTPDSNEYFLIENRQQTGWDTYIPGHGMLVWHIDYDEYIWRMNRVNNKADHQYVDIMEADGILSTGTRKGDPFPGTGNVTELTAETTPALRMWNGTSVNVPLTNITESDGIITFDVCGGGAPLEPIRFIVPVAEDATEVTESSFVANWQQVEEAEGYYVMLGQRVFGKKYTDTADFTGGVAMLPSSWNTDVTSTYNTGSYSGEATPSLRMQLDGNYIECRHDGVYGVSFWCKGSNVKPGMAVEVTWQREDGSWTMPLIGAVTSNATTLSFVPYAGGDVPSTNETSPSAEDADTYKAVRITFRKTEGGSLAIDDIVVTCADMLFSAIAEEQYTTDTSLLISGLTAATPYTYCVVAAKESMRSRQSNYIDVTTLDATDGIHAPSLDPAISGSSDPFTPGSSDPFASGSSDPFASGSSNPFASGSSDPSSPYVQSPAIFGRASSSFYTLSGQRLSVPSKSGLTIIRTTTGKAVKVAP